MADLLTASPGLDTAVSHAQSFTAGAPPAAPDDPYGPSHYEEIAALIKRKRDEWSQGRESRTRPAFLNLLFWNGDQYRVWDRMGGRFRPARLPMNHPRPVTNRFKSTLKSLIAVFARIEPKLNFRPGSDEPEDRATADVSSRAIEVIEDEVNIRRQRQMLASWVGITNGAWLETGYDPDPIHGTTLVQHEQCGACGTQQPPTEDGTCAAPSLQMPGMPCGQPTQPAVDEQGQPIGHDVPVGKMYMDVVPVFELFFDPAVTDWPRQRALLREKLLGLDEAKQRWPNEAENLAADSGGGGLDGQYAEALPTLGSFLSDASGRGALSDTPRSGVKHVVERWYWQMPDATYKDGLLAIALGRQSMKIVYAGPLPYTRKDGTPFLPFVQFPQELVPGTAWPGGVADDLRAKQTQRNQWESMMMMAARAFGMPKWFIPDGSNIGTMNGEADVIRWNPLAGAKPERSAGDPMTNAFIAFLEKLDKDFEELAGIFDILKGSRPEGVSAGIALQILQERGMSRFAPLFILWEDAWAQWASQALEIFRQFATEPRLLRIQGKDGAWQVQKFLGADLKGRIDVVAEANSSLPRSTMLERAETEQLVAMGLLNVQDPETRYEILAERGKTGLIPGMAADTKNALMEDEQFAALAQHPGLQQVPPDEITVLQTLPYDMIVQAMAGVGIPLPRLRPAVDDHGIHAREHRKWLKSESAQALPLIVQLFAEKMTEAHDLLASQQAQAIMQMQGQRPPGAGGPHRGGAGQNPMHSGSSPQRMAGDQHEMQNDMAGVA